MIEECSMFCMRALNSGVSSRSLDTINCTSVSHSRADCNASTVFIVAGSPELPTASDWSDIEFGLTITVGLPLDVEGRVSIRPPLSKLSSHRPVDSVCDSEKIREDLMADTLLLALDVLKYSL